MAAGAAARSSLLTPAQAAALAQAKENARRSSAACLRSPSFAEHLRALGCTQLEFELLVSHVARVAPLTVHAPHTVLGKISRDGRLKNYFEIHGRGGDVGALFGGLGMEDLRDEWELNLFPLCARGAVPPGPLRPKYGSLNLAGDVRGAGMAYGNVYFVLKEEVRERTTVTNCDSAAMKCKLGALDEESLAHVLLAYKREGLKAALRLMRSGGAAGVHPMTAGYLEAQVHPAAAGAALHPAAAFCTLSP